jgi:hypothetical protein
MARKFGKFTEPEVEAGTRTGTGKGSAKLHPSSGIVDEKAAHGQAIRRAFALDTSDMELRDEHGGKVAGSPTNLRHSLTTASAVQGVAPGGNEQPYIKNH